MTDWNTLIDEIVAGQWKHPETGKAATVPFETIMLAETLDGGEADVLAPLKLGKRLAMTRPRRLFGFDGTAVRDPCFSTGFKAQRCSGLPSATAPAIIADTGASKLQGGRRANEGSLPPHEL